MKKITKKFVLLAFGVGILLLAFNNTASAFLRELVTQTPGDVPARFQEVPDIIRLVFDVIITISGVVFMILLIVGGIQYLTGAGNEEATGSAKKRMIDAVIGLVIVLAAWAVGDWILTRLT